MHCGNCGHQNEESYKFCGGCGSPLNSADQTAVIDGSAGDETVPEPAVADLNFAVSPAAAPPFAQPVYGTLPPQPPLTMKRKKSKLPVIIALALVAVIGVVAAGGIFGANALNTREYEKLMDTGNKYLSELNYEEAVEVFLKAIDIKPKREDAYIGAATGYIGLGEPEKAEAILAKGLERVKKPSTPFLVLCEDLGVNIAARENGSETEAKNTTSTNLTLEPDEVDLANLKNFLDEVYGFRSFHVNTTDAIQIMEEILFDFWSQQGYDYYFDSGKTTQWSGGQDAVFVPDPLNKFEYAYVKMDADNVDWIISNIFHTTPDRTVNNDTLYYHEGYYYHFLVEGGYEDHWAEIREARRLEDGKYRITADFYSWHQKSEYWGSLDILADIRMIDGKKHWTFYEVSGKESPPLLSHSLKTGDIIRLGNYEQDNDTANGKEPIEWRVLTTVGNKVFVLSEKILEIKPYSASTRTVTWETSSLRTWLNTNFYSIAFSDKEKEQLMLRRTETFYTNPVSNEYSLIVTYDKVVLLDLLAATNAEHGFSTNSYYSNEPCDSLSAEATAFVLSKGSNMENASNFWWLRNREAPLYVDNLGVIRDRVGAEKNSYGVRPAIWINL